MDFFTKLFARRSPSPHSADDYCARGRATALSGNYRDALSDFTKTLKLNANHLEALSERGKARIEMKDYKGAIADLTRLIALQPNNAVAFQRRAKAKDLCQDYRGAVEDLDKAIKLDPAFAIAYYERGLIKIMALKDKKGAKVDLARASELGLVAASGALRQLWQD